VPKLATLPIAVLLTLVMLTPAAARLPGEVPLGDLVEVVTIRDKVIAIDARGGSQTTIRLKAKEQVEWTGARGKIGMALTNYRVLAFSVGSSAWQELSYTSGEAQPDAALLGDRVAMLVTGYRIVGFNGRFAEARLEATETVVDSRVDQSVAVCVTTHRALGFSNSVGKWVDTPMDAREQLIAVSASANFATVTTEQYIRVFRAPSASWEVRRVRD